MPQKPFVMRLHFYLPVGTGCQSLTSAAHHVEYMGSREKEELLVDSSEYNTLESAAIHAQYAGEREGSMGYLGSLATNPKRAQDSILAAQGPVWRVIASVGEEDAQAMGGALLTKAGWDQAVPPAVEKMMGTLGLDPVKTQWIGAVHRHQHHENNPHIHLLVWEEGEPSRLTAKWSRDELRAIKRDWVSALYAPERTQLDQQKAEARTQARTAVIDLMAHRNRQQCFHKELSQRLVFIGQTLPGKGRLAYTYMPPSVKQQVADTIRWLWQTDPGLKKAHDYYVKAAIQQGTFYWHANESKTQDSSGRQKALERIRQKAETDLIQRLAGPVLKTAQQQVTEGQPCPPRALIDALAHMIRGDMAHGRVAAYAFAEAQWRRKQAELAIAQNTGQQIVL